MSFIAHGRLIARAVPGRYRHVNRLEAAQSQSALDLSRCRLDQKIEDLALALDGLPEVHAPAPNTSSSDASAGFGCA
jgi:hypothetical protein